MASTQASKTPLRRFQESLVKAFYPEEFNDVEKVETRIEDLLYNFDGVQIPGSGFPKAAIKKAKDFKPRMGDILMPTYPRCGL